MTKKSVRIKKLNNDQRGIAISIGELSKIRMQQREYNQAERLLMNAYKIFHKLKDRHWKATTLQHKVRDIFYLMNFLGHRNIKNTLVYIQLEKALYGDRN